MGSLYDGPKSKPGSSRYRGLMPDNAPCYVRCYDNGGETVDRYTVVYSRVDGHPFVGMSEKPYDPQGFGQHGENERCAIDDPTYGHIGKKICFADLPQACQHLVLSDYATYWHLDIGSHPLILAWSAGMNRSHWTAPRPPKGKFDSVRRESK